MTLRANIGLPLYKDLDNKIFPGRPARIRRPSLAPGGMETLSLKSSILFMDPGFAKSVNTYRAFVVLRSVAEALGLQARFRSLESVYHQLRRPDRDL